MPGVKFLRKRNKRLPQFRVCINSLETFISSTRGTKRLVSINICSLEGNSADIFFSKVSPGIFVMKVK